jgi:hypothetical protein
MDPQSAVVVPPSPPPSSPAPPLLLPLLLPAPLLLPLAPLLLPVPPLLLPLLLPPPLELELQATAPRPPPTSNIVAPKTKAICLMFIAADTFRSLLRAPPTSQEGPSLSERGVLTIADSVVRATYCARFFF